MTHSSAAMWVVGLLAITTPGMSSGALTAPPASPVVAASVSPAAPAVMAAVDAAEVLEKFREKGKLPALGGAIFSRDKIEWVGVVGVRAIGHDEKATIDDLWHLGSCTKSMTGTLIAQMVEAGELRTEMTLSEALPKNYSIDEKYLNVTVAQLLTMTAGVPSDLQRDGLWARLWKQNGSLVEQRADLTKTMLGWGPKSEPGTQFEYSNGSFAIAGHIAEVRSGKSWEELMQERIFKPAGITTDGFGAPGTPAKDGKIDQPRGHRVKTKLTGSLAAVEVGSGADNPPGISPAGRIHMTMSDWAKYLQLHLRRGDGEPSIMKRAAFDMAHTPPEGREYAWGWGTAKRPWGGNVLTHNGSNTMWYCVTWIAPEKGFGVLVVTNAAAGDTPKVCDEVAGALIQKWMAKQK
ncbi:MAG: beta-lactamase family protein [Planctomycetes bacterium]|nr:beta-lactamase family protein [Planctomycetota bacterium]